MSFPIALMAAFWNPAHCTDHSTADIDACGALRKYLLLHMNISLRLHDALIEMERRTDLKFFPIINAIIAVGSRFACLRMVAEDCSKRIQCLARRGLFERPHIRPAHNKRRLQMNANPVMEGS